MNDTEEEKLIFLQWSVAHQILSVEMMKVIENENAGFFLILMMYIIEKGVFQQLCEMKKIQQSCKKAKKNHYLSCFYQALLLKIDY
jgi:hypothetical protein